MKPFSRYLLVLACIVAAACPAAAQTSGACRSSQKLPPPVVPETLTIPRKWVDVLGSRMSYLEIGEGEPVLFLHGNPTSAYLWRNVMPHVAKGHRAIAIDLIGMGNSAKPGIDYSFEDHYRYVSGFISALGLENLTLVGHDWGATLAWEYARRNPAGVKRLAFMEGVLPPAFPAPSFEAMGPEMEKMFRAFKDPLEGPRIVMDENMFVEQVLPGFVNRPLGEEAMRAYRAPFLSRDDRKPILAWPREVPIGGEPAATTELLGKLSEYMKTIELPVLLIYAEPGAVVPPTSVAWYVDRISHLETNFVGQGFHYLQEDHPDAIGRAIVDWMRRN